MGPAARGFAGSMGTMIHGAMLWNGQNGRKEGSNKGDIEKGHGNKWTNCA